MIELTLAQALERAGQAAGSGKVGEARAIYTAILKAVPNHGVAKKALEEILHIEKDVLFDGSDALFKDLAKKSQTYFEYGCGKSTEWVLKNTKAKVFAVDTSKEWIAKVERNTKDYQNRLQIDWVDCGELRDWGRPINYSKRENFEKYAKSLWKYGAPSLVLIDGRFRVHCCLTAFKTAPAGTMILFDDYTNRPQYHVCEEFAKIEDKCGRMVLFVAPTDKRNIKNKIIDNFKYVID